MPAKTTMTWEPSAKRWKKILHGRVLLVSCRQLVKFGYLPTDSPETKEHSRDAANRWLTDQLKTPQESQSKFGYIVTELERRRAWLAAQGFKDNPGYDQVISMIKEMEGDDTHPSIAQSFIEPMAAVWVDRLARTKPVPTDRTVGHWIDQFLSLRDVEVKAGELSRAGYDQCKWCLDAFRDWLAPTLPVESIDSTRWVEWYKHVQGMDKAAWTKKKLFSYPKSFISWLIEQGLIPAFESLHAKRYKFSIQRKEEDPLTVERIREIVGKAQGVMRLHLLLMLNAGLSQKDISDLRPSEYTDGQIHRARSKTHKKGTRVVSWKLWDSTKALLDEHAQHGERLLLTSKGTTWVGDGRRDGINSLYRHLGFPESLKRFRATAGNLIKKKLGKETADHFLGHKQGVVDSAYFARDQEELDQAVDWLGSHLGLSRNTPHRS